MKKENVNPLMLSRLQVCVLCAGESGKSEMPDPSMFDDRHDFLAESDLAAMAVQMTLYNNRCFESKNAPGVRRHLSIAIVDITEGCVISERKITVSIRTGQLVGCYRQMLRFTKADVKPDHTLKVVVKDSRSGEHLGEKIVNVYDSRMLESEPYDWYRALRGSVTLGLGEERRSVDGERMDLLRIRFDVATAFGAAPLVLPELEIRFYSPDGRTVMSGFYRPECDDYNANVYYVEYSYAIGHSDHGICYAELLSMEYPIAGFVYSTDGPELKGVWEEKDLEPMDDFSPELASERFRTALQNEKNGIRSADEKNGDTPSGSSGENPFQTDEDFERALDEFISSETQCLSGEESSPWQKDMMEEDSDTTEIVEAKSEEPLLAKLDHLTGLAAVKKKLTEYEKLVGFNRLRSEKGMPVAQTPLHAMFLGSPGTGKTTVARLMGEMLAKAGVLSQGHVVVRERSTLLGPNYSMEETNTLKAIEEAQGGILLIDEAYQLHQPSDPRDPGRFVIEALMTALADDTMRDWMLILCGYPDEMRRMFDMNPGLRSRIPGSNIYTFDDFTETELLEICERYLERNNYRLSPVAREALARKIESDYKVRDKSFGNARYVLNLLQTEVLPAMAVRVMSEGEITDDSLVSISDADIPCPAPISVDSRRIGFRA